MVFVWINPLKDLSKTFYSLVSPAKGGIKMNHCGQQSPNQNQVSSFRPSELHLSPKFYNKMWYFDLSFLTFYTISRRMRMYSSVLEGLRWWASQSSQESPTKFPVHIPLCSCPGSTLHTIHLFPSHINTKATQYNLLFKFNQIWMHQFVSLNP